MVVLLNGTDLSSTSHHHHLDDDDHATCATTAAETPENSRIGVRQESKDVRIQLVRKGFFFFFLKIF